MQWMAEKAHYEPTDEDILWLRRAVAAEGEVYPEVAHALINGFMFTRARKRNGQSLAQYVQSYSQAINPLWFPGGKFFQAAYENAHEAQKAKLLERARMRPEFARANVFSPTVEAAVNVAIANSPRVRNATDFAAAHRTHSAPWLTLTKATPGRNTLFARPGAADWPGYTVDFSAPKWSDAKVVGGVAIGLGFVLMLSLAYGSKS